MRAGRKPKHPPKAQFRFGIGEWYGKSFTSVSQDERRRLAKIQLSKGRKPPFACPFQSTPTVRVDCSKPGGVCSLRLYEKSAPAGVVRPAEGEAGRLRTICPQRFEEGGTIYRWVGETVLGCREPLVIGEIGFLESLPSEGGEESQSEVGRIDKVLVVPQSRPLSWCALEVQAVYFQGRAMRFDFDVIASHKEPGLPFPNALRRPDYRSSGPKRLMPQLQIKALSPRARGRARVVAGREEPRRRSEALPTPVGSGCGVAD